MKTKTLLTTFLGAFALMLVGCGGSSGTVLGINRNPRIRMSSMIYSPAAVSQQIDNQTIDANATFGTTSNYNIFPNGNHTIQFNTTTTNAMLVNISPLFSLNEYATVIAYNTGANTYGSMVLSDVPNAIDQSVRIRVVNVATTTGAVDAYVVIPGTSIAGSPPTIANIAVGDNTQQYVVMPQGAATYEVIVTSPGTQTVLAHVTMSSSIASGQSQTFVVADNAGAPVIEPLPAFTY